MMTVEFQHVTKSEKDVELLFALLNERKHHVSHRKAVIFSEHKKFVESNDYRFWYFVFDHKDCIGTFYIHQNNCVGINLINVTAEAVESVISFIQRTFEPNRGRASTIPPYFYVNVPNSNTELKIILRDIGLKKIQETFELN